MPFYHWEGLDRQGRQVKGVLQADNTDQLKESLFIQGIALLDYRQSTQSSNSRWSLLQPTIGPCHLADFWEQLALLLSNGVELVKALEIVARITTHKRLRSAIQNVTHAIEQGQSFYEALSAYPKIFVPVVVTLIEAGERTGKLGKIIEHVKSYYKQQYMMRQQFKRAAMAPLITLGVALMLVWAIVIFIVPQFTSLYQSLGSQLPKSTKFLIGFSRACRSWYGLIILLVMIGILWCCVQLCKIASVKKFFGQIGLYIPIISSIMIYHNMVIFIQTLSIFVSSGLTLTLALEQVEHTVGSEVFKDDIKKIMYEIMAGKSLSAAMAAIDSQFLPEQFVALVHVGESSGTLPDVLVKSESYYQELLLSRLSIVTTLFSPLLMIVVGVIIAFIMVMLYMPIFNLGNLIKF
jgi:type IV pilus assembly protein PilC